MMILIRYFPIYNPNFVYICTIRQCSVMYKLFARLFGAEVAFGLFMIWIRLLDRMKFLLFFRLMGRKDYACLHRDVFGMEFAGPAGLGVGIDRGGLYYNVFAGYGLSFVITGPADTDGVCKSIGKIKREAPKIKVICCLSEEHTRAFSLSYDFMDAFIIDASDDKIKDVVTDILDTRLTYEVQKPILMKIGHDFSKQTLDDLLDFALMNGVDGFYVCSANNVAKVNEFCKGRMPVIGYGDIRSAKDAEDILASGASLFALSNGIMLEGPGLVSRILKHLNESCSPAGN